MRHGLIRKDGVCSGLWSWELLILERTSPWHCLWCQLQCICRQVYRFLNLPPSVWWHKIAQVRAALPMICDVQRDTNRHTFLFLLPNWENKSINAYRALVRDNRNTVPRLASSPRKKSHMQCQPRGRVYNVISPTTPGAWILLLSGTKQNSI